MAANRSKASVPQAQPLTELIRTDRSSLARAITVVENNLEGASDILNEIESNLGRAHIVGITGPPGVGKSTLIDTAIGEIRKLGKSVAVLAVDPSSHISGGAILGDRVRMAGHSDDDDVFIRSVAARGHLGGLSATALNIVHVFDAAGWDIIVVETVGTGQSEIEISELADTTVVIESPGLGDEVQAIKAGLLEIADVIVVNKADLPQADLTVSELNHAIALRHSAKTPAVLKTSATENEGIVELVAEINRHGSEAVQGDRSEAVNLRSKKIVARILGESVERQFRQQNTDGSHHLARQIQTGSIDADELAEKIVQNFVSNSVNED